jgi:hypothetical protein
VAIINPLRRDFGKYWRSRRKLPINNRRNKPVGDRDHEVLGMGSFGEYTQLYWN